MCPGERDIAEVNHHSQEQTVTTQLHSLDSGTREHLLDLLSASVLLNPAGI